MRSVKRVLVDGVEIILVGTGHILEKSVREVEEVISHENPDIIAVELCEARYRALKGEVDENFSVENALKGGNPFLLLTQWLLAYIQRKMGSELGVEPGAEMMAAIDAAEKRGIPFVLVDRPIQITMQRFWSKMNFFEKVKMLFSLASALFSMRKLVKGEDEHDEEKSKREKDAERDAENAASAADDSKKAVFGRSLDELNELTDEDVVTQLLNEFRKFSPGAATALLDERDAYIASKLLSLAKSLKAQRCNASLRTTTGATATTTAMTTTATTAAGGGDAVLASTAAVRDAVDAFGEVGDVRAIGKIVAVVGAGHREGILKYLKNPETLPDISALCESPSERKRRFLSLNFMLGAGLLAVVVLLVVGCIISGVPLRTFLTALFWWFLINGVLSFAGVIAARGHLMSGIVAFAVAWLTSLNPFIAAGWFAGIEEAKIRKPSVEDARRMLKAESMKELMNNNLFKVILVAAFANIGSMIGTFLGLYVVLNVLGVNIPLIIHQIFDAIF